MPVAGTIIVWSKGEVGVRCVHLYRVEWSAGGCWCGDGGTGESGRLSAGPSPLLPSQRQQTSSGSNLPRSLVTSRLCWNFHLPCPDLVSGGEKQASSELNGKSTTLMAWYINWKTPGKSFPDLIQKSFRQKIQNFNKIALLRYIVALMQKDLWIYEGLYVNIAEFNCTELLSQTATCCVFQKSNKDAAVDITFLSGGLNCTFTSPHSICWTNFQN